MSRRSNNAAGFFNLGGYKEGCADGVVSGWDSAMARAGRLVEIGEELGRLEQLYVEDDQLAMDAEDEINRPDIGYLAYHNAVDDIREYHHRCLSIVRNAERLVDEVIRIKRGE